MLFCTAGGTNPDHLGFFADLTTEQLNHCFKLNYDTSLYVTHAIVKLWIADLKEKKTGLSNLSIPPRHVILTSSTAAFVAFPGYVGYAPAKVATRCLADTLRQEFLLYERGDAFKIHCSFPGTFVSDAFLHEQYGKPELLKILEGTDVSNEELVRTKESTKSVARKILKGVDRGDFFITMDFEGDLLINNMRGPSPRNSCGFWDWLIGLLVPLIWVVVRRRFDLIVKEYGSKMKGEKLQST
jgi:3-dehydrosphinganine reductase